MLYHYRSNAKSFITKQALVQLAWERSSRRNPHTGECRKLPKSAQGFNNPQSSHLTRLLLEIMMKSWVGGLRVFIARGID